MTDILLDNGADVNAQGGTYGNALQAASFNGHERIVKMLLNNGAHINAQGGTYGNALQAASLNGHERIVKMLLDNGADVNAQGGTYGNALQAASLNGNERIVEMLLDNGTNKNGQGGKYETPGQVMMYNDVIVGTEEGNMSDAASDDVSDVPSVFSTTSGKTTSTEIFDKLRDRSPSEVIASVLIQDDVLYPLYIDAISKVSHDRFFANHDRLLKKFLSALNAEAQEEFHIQAIRFLRHRYQRQDVTSRIYKSFEEKNSSFTVQDLSTNTPHAVYQPGGTKSQQGPGRRPVEPVAIQNHASDSSSDSSENEEDALLDGGGRLDSITDFMTSGRPFEAFKESFKEFVNPPQTIKDALEANSKRALRRLLKNQFHRVAVGEYAWLEELSYVGYSPDEIAALLLEQRDSSPWIYFEQKGYKKRHIQPNFHLDNCVHRVLGQPLNDKHPESSISEMDPTIDKQEATRLVYELCGVAGVSPISKDKQAWVGSIKFQGHVATVTYGTQDEQTYNRPLLARICHALSNLSTAAGTIQYSKLCCDCITVAVLPEAGAPYSEIIQLRRLSLGLASDMLTSLLEAADERRQSARDQPISKAGGYATQIVSLISQTTFLGSESEEECLHICALATQLLCMAFVSYSQAHVGPISPFFLETELKTIHLVGTGDKRICISVELSDLACMGEMIRGQAITFGRSHTASEAHPIPKPPKGFLVGTCASDLLDTWGPGQLVVQKGNFALVSTIVVGGGAMWCSDLENQIFHWSPNLPEEPTPTITIGPDTQMVIGSPIVLNENCGLQRELCVYRDSPFGHQLGTKKPYWERDGAELGGQAGNFALLIASTSWHKIPGETIKQSRLGECGPSLMSLLDKLWGLQVSYCTGISRRVPLYEVVTDLLDTFRSFGYFPNDEVETWKDFTTPAEFAANVNGGKLRDYIGVLKPDHCQTITRIVWTVLKALRYTGIDREGRNLVVGWPQKDIFYCFKIPCKDEHAWAKILAESEHCATFAYVTFKCLENSEFKCSTTWKNQISLLETSVIIYSTNHESLSTNHESLQHQDTYVFETFDKRFFVTVHKPNNDTIARLGMSSIPDRFWKQVKETLLQKNRWKRIQERHYANQLAEQVVVR
ncbi:hypothetical protein SLS62_007138 [Diatrype stigma]|uniref:Uncharacterized protein n=1 Tax=Diatrype stigma TaxID=117547 RepID=A0AAN9YQZ2_9PEZI